MSFPIHRLRRLRRSEGLRRLVRETHVRVGDLIAPIFLCDGEGQRQEIPSMPGIYRYSVDAAVEEAKLLYSLKIPAVLLFGVPHERRKDGVGKEAWASDGLVQKALRAMHEQVPGLVLIADTCFCEYTEHGHCGVLNAGKEVQNDRTLENLALTAVSQARSGADLVAPSGMMDGAVQAIRTALDTQGFTDVGIMAYSAKYASAFYGPFRDAADSTPSFGDRRQYQMDFHNIREAVRETELDVEEGADIVMVKPALAYLDVIRAVRESVHVPLAAYNVSGEFSMVKAAAKRGWIDEKRTALEITTGIKRAGADLIITYWAKDLATWLEELPAEPADKKKEAAEAAKRATKVVPAEAPKPPKPPKAPPQAGT
ncbi:MAG: porphobilinogen synthase [Planctomycetota bacterium]|nr:porphobilinogen synthase [Planctomycetota bacterium]